MHISYKRATNKEELVQILELQKRNLPDNISEAERTKEGFVTVHHTLEILRKMNNVCAHILAKDEAKVVGYALCMHPQFGQDIEVLKPMFREIDTAISEDISYIVMGQVCIDKPYRKKGIFRALYEHMQRSLAASFDMIITEVDAANVRSLQAHYALGFEDLKTYRSGGQDWHLIFLDT